MKAYSPPIDGRSDFGGLLLDFNERTVPVGRNVINALRNFIEKGDLQTYPEYFDLNEKIADYAGVKSDQVMIVNGSDQGIDVIFRTFTSDGDKVLVPKETFAMFSQCALLNGNKIVYDFEKDVRLVVICNPNNPTGEIISLKEIEAILKKAKNSMVYIDEAYFEYSKVSAVSLLDKYPNLVISRTFSKAWGLASLRIGYVLASKESVGQMLKVRGPYDVNMVAFCAVNEALDDRTYMEKYVDEVMNVAKPMVEKFFEKNAVAYTKSFSNFILFKPKNPLMVFQELKNKGILTRPRGDSIRVTIGTKTQMKKFIIAYKQILDERVKCAFIDRDGTLIFEPGNGGQVKKCRILPGVIDGLKRLRDEGFKLIMVTNQDGLGGEIFPQSVFDFVQDKLLGSLKKEGIEFDEIFVCPHFESDKCLCRKPGIGLVSEYLKQNKIDLKRSIMFGDRDSDEVFAGNLGVRFIRIKKNNQFIYET